MIDTAKYLKDLTDDYIFHKACDHLFQLTKKRGGGSYEKFEPRGRDDASSRSRRGQPDSLGYLDFKGKEIDAFQYTIEDFRYKGKADKKLNKDLQETKKLEERGYKISSFHFASSYPLNSFYYRQGGSETPFIEYWESKIGTETGWQVKIWGLEELSNEIDTYYPEVRRTLCMPELHFQSIDEFEKKFKAFLKATKAFIPQYIDRLQDNVSIEGILQSLEEREEKVLLVEGTGGIGKTRFVLEALKKYASTNPGVEIAAAKWKSQHVSTEAYLEEFDKDKRKVIFIDDIHTLRNLEEWVPILTNESVYVIATTRPGATSQLEASLSGLVRTETLGALDEEASRKILDSGLRPKISFLEKEFLLKMCEGNPLLLGLAICLINAGEIRNVGDLKRAHLMRSYLESLVTSIKASKSEISLVRYEPFIACCYLLRPYLLTDKQTRACVRKIVGIDDVEEGYILNDLLDLRILEQHGGAVWLFLDLIGDLVVEKVFFSDSSILEMDDFLSQIPEERRISAIKALRDAGVEKAEPYLEKQVVEVIKTLEDELPY